MSGKLYVVATPIGNIEDMSRRGVDILDDVDIIAAEDTRVLKQLGAMLGIKLRGLAYHKFNERQSAQGIIDLILQGQNAALVSDAGTPCISDPGYFLVESAIMHGIEVTAVPGASAVVAALSISGFEVDNFSFHGFFPRKDGAELLKKLLEETVKTLVFYESPMRIAATMELISAVCPGCGICLANDLTKKFERIYRGTPGDVLAELMENANREKGEYTLIINLADNKKSGGSEERISKEALLIDICVRQGCGIKDAISLAAKEHGIPKRELYSASLTLKEMFK